MFYKYTFFTLFAILFLIACEPSIDPEIEVPTATTLPEFSFEFAADNPNAVVFTDNSTGFFDRLWEFPGGTPNSASFRSDTVFFGTAGSYEVTLYASANDGSGVASTTRIVNIDADAEVTCDPTVSLLTGDCGESGKCWIFSRVGGAISVGPVPGSGEWYSSPADGLVEDQYDDRFCFFFDGATFEYLNNGLTINPFNGYVAEPFELPPNQTWTLTPGGGEEGGDLLTVPEGAFLGVRDTEPEYEIVTLTEEELVVRSRILDADEGWFELYFVAQ